MTEPAAFRGVYADWKLIKTRACVQVVFEIPIEQADDAYQALGGMPVAAREIWCGIATLDEKKLAGGEVVTQHAVNVPTAGSNPARSATKEKRQFSDMPPAQQAGMLSDDRAFRLFLAEKFDMPVPSPDEAAAVIRHHCKVESRSNIKPGNPAAFAEWSALVLAYRLWQREPEFV